MLTPHGPAGQPTQDNVYTNLEGNSLITSITLNIPVRDIARSRRLLTRLGFRVDPLFAQEADMELINLSDTVNVMLNSEPRFQSISRKELADTSRQAEAILQLRVNSRNEVDEIVDAAVAEGCTPIHEPNDQGYMYGRSFQDPDGHNWDFFWVDVAR
jgi:uncharacterized protein